MDYQHHHFALPPVADKWSPACLIGKLNLECGSLVTKNLALSANNIKYLSKRTVRRYDAVHSTEDEPIAVEKVTNTRIHNTNVKIADVKMFCAVYYAHEAAGQLSSERTVRTDGRVDLALRQPELCTEFVRLRALYPDVDPFAPCEANGNNTDFPISFPDLAFPDVASWEDDDGNVGITTWPRRLRTVKRARDASLMDVVDASDGEAAFDIEPGDVDDSWAHIEAHGVQAALSNMAARATRASTASTEAREQWREAQREATLAGNSGRRPAAER
jgi:hypothetical protein